MQQIPSVRCYTCGTITGEYWSSFNQLKPLYKNLYDALFLVESQHLSKSDLLLMARNLMLQFGIINSSNIQSLLDQFDIKYDVNNPNLTEQQILELMTQIGIVRFIDELTGLIPHTTENSYDKSVASSLNHLGIVRYCCRRGLIDPPQFIPYVEKQPVGQEAEFKPFNDLVLERRQQVLNCQHPLYSIYDDAVLVELSPQEQPQLISSNVQMPLISGTIPVMPLLPVNTQPSSTILPVMPLLPVNVSEQSILPAEPITKTSTTRRIYRAR